MNTQRDHIDEAIDRVAASLTKVAHDDGFALRVITALPQRSGWSMRWLMPRLAVTAALAIAAVLIVLRAFDDRSTDVLRTFNDRSAIVPVTLPVAAEHRTNVEPTLIVRRTNVEPSSNDRRTSDAPDHERSLEALEGLPVLSLTVVAPREALVQGALVVEPLAIADLPLTAESISPR